MICPACQKNVQPYAEFDLSGIVDKCPACQAVIPKTQASSDVAQLEVRSVVSGKDVGSTPAVGATSKNNTEPPNAKKVIRERLKYVNQELRRLKALQNEKAELERLLNAARKPRVVKATVRSLRAA